MDYHVHLYYYSKNYWALPLDLKGIGGGYELPSALARITFLLFLSNELNSSFKLEP
jgi:hypothetical protein